MNRRIRLAVVALAVLAFVAAGAFVFAQGGPPQQRPHGQMMGQGPGGGRGPGGPMMLGRLNLTDAQRAQVQKLMQDNRQAHQPLMQKMMEAEKALRDAIFADQPNPDAIAAATRQIQELEPQMLQNRIDMETAVAKILTPEQRQQLRQMQPPTGGRMGRGRGGMMHHPAF